LALIVGHAGVMVDPVDRTRHFYLAETRYLHLGPVMGLAPRPPASLDRPGGLRFPTDPTVEGRGSLDATPNEALRLQWSPIVIAPTFVSATTRGGGPCLGESC
jgi:hypothetical protein